ncbi:uncharacterized protein [Osmerus mordax]|uniref:uncharacterized protein isoform X1 n=2 Tax=Osmerus mordax TaxID=8014 RepID=UPI00350FA675
MAEVEELLNESKCPICLDLPKDPKTTQCGHTHCKVCFNEYWDQHDQSDSCCPQCSRASILQPATKVTEETGREECVSPAKNDTQLCSKTDLYLHNQPPVIGKDSPSTQQSVCTPVLSDELNVLTECADGHPEGDNSGPASEKKCKKGHRHRKKSDPPSTYNNIIEEREEELKNLKEEMESLKRSTLVTVEDCEKFFTELVERTTSELRERIQAQEGAMLREAEGHLQTLEAELVELRRAEAEHKPLAPIDERPHFFQKIPSITSAFGTVQRSVYRLQKQLEMDFDMQLKDFFLEAKLLLEPHTLSSLADRVVEEHELEDYKDIESVRTKEMFAQMEDILNRLTPERFPQLMRVVATFPITTEERLRGIVDLIYEEAISDPDNSEAYAQMCKCLQLRKVPSSDKPGETLNFRKLMLNRCLVDFERKHTEGFKEFFDKMNTATEKEQRSLHGEKLEEVFSELQYKAVGNIKFICEFFKLNMMTEAQMHEFLTKLVRRRDAISIACFSTMLSTIGKDLDHGKAEPRMDQYYKHVEVIVKEKNSSVPDRHVLFELHQLLKDRQEEDTKDPELVKTQEMFAKMEDILIHVNRENFQQVMKEVGTLPINTEERLKGFIDLIYQKAISDPDNSEVYANMCRSQMGREVPCSDNRSKTLNFRKLLLNCCQEEFDKDKTEGLRKKQKELEAAVDNKDCIRLREEIRVITSEVQADAVGNVKLISELFKMKMVTEAIMHDCIVALLKRKENIALSCVYTILSTVCKDLDNDKSKPRMDQYYKQIEKIVKDKKIPPHVCNELTELLEIRQGIWRNRDQKLSGSKSMPDREESGKMTEREEK